MDEFRPAGKKVITILSLAPKWYPGSWLYLERRYGNVIQKLPELRFWSEETLNVTLRQIEFYYECGFLQIRSMVSNYAMNTCLSSGKSKIGQWLEYKERPEHRFDLYKNDLLIADNTIFFRMGDQRITFVPFNTMNILTTSHDNFCRRTEDYLMNLTTKSILISTTGEKDRNKFFNLMEGKIHQLKTRLSSL